MARIVGSPATGSGGLVLAASTHKDRLGAANALPLLIRRADMFVGVIGKAARLPRGITNGPFENVDGTSL